MVNFTDLVIPDATYLERYDCIFMLDRLISEPAAAVDSIRHPVLKPDREVMSWQGVHRAGFPAQASRFHQCG